MCNSNKIMISKYYKKADCRSVKGDFGRGRFTIGCTYNVQPFYLFLNGIIFNQTAYFVLCVINLFCVARELIRYPLGVKHNTLFIKSFVLLIPLWSCTNPFTQKLAKFSRPPFMVDIKRWQMADEFTINLTNWFQYVL